MEEYNMIDNGAGILATAAGYKIVMNKLGYYPGFVGFGCQLIAACIGLEVGSLVRAKTKNIRKGVAQFKTNTDQKKEKEEWWKKNLPDQCKKCAMNIHFSWEEPCRHCDVANSKEVQNG